MNGEDMDRRMHWLRLARELGQEDDFRALMDDLRQEGAESVLQPVGREALERVVREHKAFERMPMSNKQLDKDYTALVDAVLAVLAGREVAP